MQLQFVYIYHIFASWTEEVENSWKFQIFLVLSFHDQRFSALFSFSELTEILPKTTFHSPKYSLRIYMSTNNLQSADTHMGIARIGFQRE